MFAQCAVRHTSFAQRTSLGEAVIICRRQTSFKKRTFVLVDKSAFFVGGRRWIRTTEGIASRFTVCPLWPLGNSPIFNWSWWTDLNPRPADYKSAALPTELHQRVGFALNARDNIAHKSAFVKSFFKEN